MSIEAAEQDARQRGTWFFQINFVATKQVKLGSTTGEETIAGGSFEVLQFAPTFKELDIYEEDEDPQVEWEPSSIYNKLELIRRGETMAFVKMSDLQSVALAEARREHRSIKYFTFNLKKFSRRGGVIAKFDVPMQGVFILDMRQESPVDKVLITFSRTTMEGSMPSK